jgi:hypothetical protein
MYSRISAATSGNCSIDSRRKSAGELMCWMSLISLRIVTRDATALHVKGKIQKRKDNARTNISAVTLMNKAVNVSPATLNTPFVVFTPRALHTVATIALPMATSATLLKANALTSIG